MKKQLLVILLSISTTSNFLANQDILDAIKSINEVKLFSLLKNANWQKLSNNKEFKKDLIETLQKLNSKEDLKNQEERLNEVRARGWISLILSKLNPSENLTEKQLENWTNGMKDKNNCLTFIPRNFCGIAIHLFGEYPNLNPNAKYKECGLALGVTESNKTSFPSFRHTTLSEIFEFLSGRGIIALMQGDQETILNGISAKDFNILVETNKIEKKVRYLVTVEASDRLNIPAGTYIQIMPNHKNQLKFLIITTPPFSYIEKGFIDNKIEEETKSLWKR